MHPPTHTHTHTHPHPHTHTLKFLSLTYTDMCHMTPPYKEGQVQYTDLTCTPHKTSCSTITLQARVQVCTCICSIHGCKWLQNTECTIQASTIKTFIVLAMQLKSEQFNFWLCPAAFLVGLSSHAVYILSTGLNSTVCSDTLVLRLCLSRAAKRWGHRDMPRASNVRGNIHVLQRAPKSIDMLCTQTLQTALAEAEVRHRGDKAASQLAANDKGFHCTVHIRFAYSQKVMQTCIPQIIILITIHMDASMYYT